jgi:hypothetical protein
MDIRIHKHGPTAHEVADLGQEVDKLRARIAKFAVDLTTEQRRHEVRFRPGGEPIVRLVTELARAEGVSLPRVAADDVLATLHMIERIKPLVDAVGSLAQTLAVTLFEAQAECWWGTTALYTVLTCAARNDARLGNSLQPAVNFFATGPRKGSNAGTTPPAPPTTTGSP